MFSTCFYFILALQREYYADINTKYFPKAMFAVLMLVITEIHSIMLQRHQCNIFAQINVWVLTLVIRKCHSMKCYRETNVKYFYKEIFWGFVVSNSQSPSMKCSRVYTNENIGKEYVGVLL